MSGAITDMATGRGGAFITGRARLMSGTIMVGRHGPPGPIAMAGGIMRRAISAPVLWPLVLSSADVIRHIEWIRAVRRQNRLIAQAMANLCSPCRRDGHVRPANPPPAQLARLLLSTHHLPDFLEARPAARPFGRFLPDLPAPLRGSGFFLRPAGSPKTCAATHALPIIGIVVATILPFVN